MKKLVVTVAACAALAGGVAADVRTTERSSVKFEGMLGRMVGLFGGADDNDTPRTVAVRGDRKASLSGGSGQIIDLAEEKVYDLDARRKTYEVTTFDELRREIEEARKEAEEDAADEGEEQPGEPGGPEYEIDFAVRETGQRRSIAGFDSRQVIALVTMRQKGRTLEEGGGLVLTSDMWLAPRIAALDEIGAFDRRYAEKLYGIATGMSADQLAALLAMHPGFQKAQERLAAEGAKLEGTPLLTTLTLESVKNPEQQESSGGGGIGGMAGRLMRRNRDKPGQKNKVFTSTHEILSIDASVAAADVQVPGDYKEKR